MSEWQTFCLKDLGKIVTGKTPKTSNLDFFNGKYMFITPNDLHGTYRVIKTPRTLSDSGLKSIQNNTIDNISILVGCIGDVGMVRMCFDKCATNQQINSITDIKDFCNPYYLYYYLSNKKELFKNIALSTVVPIIPKTIFQEIEVLLPNIETQQKIARTLSILDQKIENNHKINELLHKILELLYEQYFVRFDFLDENNKPYQTSGGKMKFSKELNRLIPSGWSVRFLNHKIVSTYQPKTISKTLLNDSYSYSVYGGGGIIGRFTEYNHEQSEFIISCRGQCGISYLTLPKSWITGNAMVIRPTKSYTSKTYLYHTIKKYKLTNYITGSVQPQITRQNLSTMPILIPKRKTLNKWNNISSLLWNLIHNNMQSTQTLTALRDFLLPLLLKQQVKPQ
ncbi:restriction endonuclease subunit S [Helicobacter pylori]|nr:restriction endonuclease subunit S [Helicobacter pylori]